MRILHSIGAVCLLLVAACGSTGSRDEAAEPARDDPRSGWITLRVVDDTTGLPIANTRCRMLHIESYRFGEAAPAKYKSDYAYALFVTPWEESASPYSAPEDKDGPRKQWPAWLTTDAAGEIHVELPVWSRPEREGGERETTVYLPSLLPENHIPLTNARWLAEAAVEAWRNPSLGPIEIRAKPFARIHGRVVDADGQPVAGAHVRGMVRTDLYWQWEALPPGMVNSGAENWLHQLRAIARAEAIRLEVATPSSLTETAKRGYYHELREHFDTAGGQPYRAPITGADGTFSMPALAGAWTLCASGAGYEPGIAMLEHGDADSEINIIVGPRLARLTLDIKLPDDLPSRGKGGDSERPKLSVTLSSAPPMLRNTDLVLEWIGDRPLEESSVRLEFSGVPPIWMRAEVWYEVWRDNDWYDGASHGSHFLLAPGKAGELLLPLGKGAVQLELDPPGIRPEAVDLEIEAPPTLYRHKLSFERDSEYKLPHESGSYIAHLPDGSRVPFEVRHGEVTTLQVESPLPRLEFRLGDELAQLLGEPVELSLSQDRGHSGRWTFEDGSAVTLVPAGVYTWTLQGSKAFISHEVDLRAAESPIVLAEDSLPGLERMELEIVGPWKFDPQPKRRIIRWHHGRGTLEFVQAGGAAQTEAGTWIVWGPPGGFELHVREERPADGGGGEYTYRLAATAPGSMRVDLSAPRAKWRLEGRSECHVWLANGDSVFLADVLYDYENKKWPTLELWLPAGAYEAYVWTPYYEYRWRGELASDGVALQLNDLERPQWQEVQIKLTVTGPESTFSGEIEAEMREAMERFAQARPALYRRHGESWRLVRRMFASGAWGERDLERGSTAPLAPGRYRVDAWLGAPEEYRKEFTVADQDIAVELSLD